MTITIGSLCTGYGGLDMGITQHFGGAQTVWTSDIDEGANAIIRHRYPHSPNLGDMTEVDWANVQPADVICGGTPCQDLSTAGRRAGMKPGTRSGLWESMFTAIKTLRPHLVVWENVQGAYSAPAFSLMEPRPRRLGEPARGFALRALGRVLGDLAGIGYDAQWVGVRASDVGAPHPRFRAFVVAHPQGDSWWVEQRKCPTSQRETGSSEGMTFLPTPKASDGEFGYPRTSGRPPEKSTFLATRLRYDDFGKYRPAIQRWEHVIGRPAPPATRAGKNGNPQLSATFVEWMMGLPDGWVTAPEIGLTRTQQLHALGNGVVPQQAAHALNVMHTNERNQQ